MSSWFLSFPLRPGSRKDPWETRREPVPPMGRRIPAGGTPGTRDARRAATRKLGFPRAVWDSRSFRAEGNPPPLRGGAARGMAGGCASRRFQGRLYCEGNDRDARVGRSMEYLTLEAADHLTSVEAAWLLSLDFCQHARRHGRIDVDKCVGMLRHGAR